jgi:hypothetical protein
MMIALQPDALYKRLDRCFNERLMLVKIYISLASKFLMVVEIQQYIMMYNIDATTTTQTM